MEYTVLLYIWGVIVGWVACELYDRLLAPKMFNTFAPRSKRIRFFFALSFNFFAPVVLALYTVPKDFKKDNTDA